MDETRFKSLIIVLEGFLVLQVAHFVGGNFVASVLIQKYPDLPQSTAATIASSDISPLVAILYMALRSGWCPSFKLNHNVVPGSVAGIFLTWLICFIGLLFFDKENPEAREILSLPRLYLYHGVFSVSVWNPVLEEVMTRGYFFEILRKEWSLAFSVIVSTLAFVFSHAFWGAWGPGIILIACNSLAFTLVYVQGGVWAAVITHIFVNSYILFLNS